MDRNTVLAFALSMLVFLLYLTYQQHRLGEAQPVGGGDAVVEEQAEPSESAAKASSGASAAHATGDTSDGSAAETMARADTSRSTSVPIKSRGTASLPPEPDPETHTLRNENVIAEISNAPAWIQSWQIKDYMERLPEGGDVPIDLIAEHVPAMATDVAGVAGATLGSRRFEVVSSSPREIVQRAADPTGTLTRTLRLDESGYGFEVDLSFQSDREDPVDVRLELVWPAAMSTRMDFHEVSLLAYAENGGVTRELVSGVGKPSFFGRLAGRSPESVQRIDGDVEWAGFDLRYFTGVLIDPEDRGALDASFEVVDPGKVAQTRIALQSATVGSGGRVDRTLRGYFGPKESKRLAAAGPALGRTINRGWSWLEPLTRFFEEALDFLYRFIPNYGLAIIVLTILVRTVVSPLMIRQMRSAEKMRAVQPRMKAVQEKYKDDRQKQSEEVMKLFREEGINPLGGCAPLLLQFPVLIGLFYSLRSSIALRHAPFFGWINDLSQPATLFVIPGLDFPVRILPLIMGASMFAQQKMTPSAGMDPSQARMMQVMMPGMMLLVSYTFPSGLVLYWTVSNLLGIAHQYWIRSKMQSATA